MRASSQRGNEIPPLMSMVNEVIFKALFSMADGTLKPGDSLNYLKTNLPWEFVKKAAYAQRQVSHPEIGMSNPLPGIEFLTFNEP